MSIDSLPSPATLFCSQQPPNVPPYNLSIHQLPKNSLIDLAFLFLTLSNSLILSDVLSSQKDRIETYGNETNTSLVETIRAVIHLRNTAHISIWGGYGRHKSCHSENEDVEAHDGCCRSALFVCMLSVVMDVEWL